MKTLEKMAEGRWRVIENATGPRWTALVIGLMLIGYSIVGFLE